MALPVCQHMKLGGAGRCGSPAMRGQDYCYFHAPAHRAIPSVNLNPRNRKASSLRQAPDGLLDADHQNVPWQRCRLTGRALELQTALSRFVQGISQGLLNVRQGKIIIAALQQAMGNRRDRPATADPAVTSNQLRLQLNARSPLSTSSSAMAQPIEDKSDVG